jgi:thymidine kinase
MAILQVISGTMGAGKTDKLCSLYHSIAELNPQSVLAIKPSKDTRSAVIESRSGAKITDVKIIDCDTPHMIFHHLIDIAYLNEQTMNTLPRNIFISEVQFFSREIIQTVDWLLDLGLNVCVEGLMTDSKGNIFGYTHELSRIAKEQGIYEWVDMDCEVCSSARAVFNKCLVNSTEQVFIGGSNEYKAVCKNCFEGVKVI